MLSSKSFRNAFVLLVIVGLLNYLAVQFSLYWTLHYFDSLVHFTAGISVGFAVLWLYQSLRQRMLSTKEILIVALLGTFVVGVLWEVFELYFGITEFSDGKAYWTDTTFDLCMDTLGALVAALYTIKLHKN